MYSTSAVCKYHSVLALIHVRVCATGYTMYIYMYIHVNTEVLLVDVDVYS